MMDGSFKSLLGYVVVMGAGTNNKFAGYTPDQIYHFLRAGQPNTVDQPTHHFQEYIDMIKDATENMNALEALYTASVLQYVWRWRDKNGVEDLKKARGYLDMLIANQEKNEK